MAVSERRAQAFGRVVILAVLNLFALLLLAQVQWNILNTGSYGLTIGITGRVQNVDSCVIGRIHPFAVDEGLGAQQGGVFQMHGFEVSGRRERAEENSPGVGEGKAAARVVEGCAHAHINALSLYGRDR